MGVLVYRFRWFITAIWTLIALLLAVRAPKPDFTVGESGDLLPANTPVHQALSQLSKHFGDQSSLSAVVVVFERQTAPLTESDLAEIEQTAAALIDPNTNPQIALDLHNISLRSPATFALAGKANPLLSRDGHGAVVWLSLPFNYISKPAARLVQHAQDIVAGRHLPSGLSAAVTGSAGFGYDYALATQRSHGKTTVVTVISVLVILLLVYRAPIAAVVPLGAISLAAVVVFKLLAMGERFGLHNGMAEQIFTFVLLYGAGVDYSLLFMSRYREFLDAGHDLPTAIAKSLDASIGTITSSAVMTICGVGMLCFARFSVFHNAGPAVMLAVAIAAIAAPTLVPAILAITGRRAFWPMVHQGHVPRVGRLFPSLWLRVSHLIVHRPALVLIVTCVALLPPAFLALGIRWNYDAIYSLKSFYPARQGEAMVERHWATGEITPVNILLVTDEPQPLSAWNNTAAKMAHDLPTIAEVDHIRCLTQPLGPNVTPAENAALMLIARQKVLGEFLSPDKSAMRVTVVLKVPPFSAESMNSTTAITRVVEESLLRSKLSARVYLTGATAEMVDIRTVTQQDFQRVAMRALIAILIVVALVLGELSTALFILAATVLSYLTTLGITSWVFEHLGSSGLEWKVQMLVFIVLVAVGQDYSLFFAMRLKQERRAMPLKAAVERALIFTGPVISSCGLIMAATLGSIMTADVYTLVQLGFAFAVGMLIDTFMVRPLLLPAFVMLTQRDAAGLTFSEN